MMSFRIVFVNSSSVISVTRFFCGLIKLLIVEKVFELTFHYHIYLSNIIDMFQIFVLNKWILKLLPIWCFYIFESRWTFSMSLILSKHFHPTNTAQLWSILGCVPIGTITQRLNHLVNSLLQHIAAIIHIMGISDFRF